MNASPLSPPLTPISGWVNPPPCLHECCNFTCLVSYHLDFHQLDLGSLTGLQNCWHPAPRFIVSCEWLVNDVTSQSTTRGCTEWSAVTHRSTNCARCCLTSVIWREPLSLLCHALGLYSCWWTWQAKNLLLCSKYLILKYLICFCYHTDSGTVREILHTLCIMYCKQWILAFYLHTVVIHKYES